MEEITAHELSLAFDEAQDQLFEDGSPYLMNDELTGAGMHEKARISSWYQYSKTAEEFRNGVFSDEWPD